MLEEVPNPKRCLKITTLTSPLSETKMLSACANLELVEDLQRFPHWRTNRMAIVAVTRLQLRSFPFILPLNWASMKIERTLVASPGFLGGKVLADRNHAYWTMTSWKDLDSMRAFR